MIGAQGLMQVFNKYVVRALRTTELEIFFDLCVLVNVVFLALNGLIDDTLINLVNSVVTFTLLIELGMKLVSTPMGVYISRS
jgi:hypothetical protein